jgi:hypothetical protein
MHPKYLTIFVFLVFAIKLSGQILPKGKFVSSTAYASTEITIKGKNKFSYQLFSYTGGQKGDGTYSLTDSTFILKFNSSTSETLPLKPIMHIDQNSADSAVIYIKLFNQRDNVPLPRARITYHSDTYTRYYVRKSNDSGEAKLSIALSDLPTILNISHYKIYRQHIFIYKSGDYSITVPLNFEAKKVYNKGDTIEFVINSFTDNELVLKEKIYDKEFRTYLKK